MALTSEQEESFRDTVSHIDKQGNRVWFYPKKPAGRYYNARTLITYLYLIVFFGLPFVKVNGNPFFLMNVLERKFILFGVRFWPQDFFIFVLGMLIFILFIALFTVVFGRVFCGWVCPQTVFMEMVFRKIEYAIEGDFTHQKALNKAPWTATKIRKKGLKWTIFFIISVLVANTFLAYIIGVDELKKIITEPLSQHIGGFVMMIVFSAVFFFIYLWFREQVCLVVCPYGRMQGVLLDQHSIVVAYDHVRGEPREKYSKSPSPGTGDCIDCFECVRVCPTGIDIRHGTQLECVNCTACIDACDHIMEKTDRPKGLIRYASEFNIVRKRKLRITPRMIAYTGILLALVTLESFLLVTRSDLDVTMIRARGMLFNREPDGRINNLYSVKILNKTHSDMTIEFRPQMEGAEAKPIIQPLTVKADSLLESEMFIILGVNSIRHQKEELKIDVWSSGKKIQTIRANFLGPAVKSSNIETP